MSPPPQDQRGLGYVNGTADLLRISVPLQGDGSADVKVEALAADEACDALSKPTKQSGTAKRSAKTSKKSAPSAEEHNVVVEVRQDVSSSAASRRSYEADVTEPR